MFRPISAWVARVLVQVQVQAFLSPWLATPLEVRYKDRCNLNQLALSARGINPSYCG